jgi:hypothetical protein
MLRDVDADFIYAITEEGINCSRPAASAASARSRNLRSDRRPLISLEL